MQAVCRYLGYATQAGKDKPPPTYDVACGVVWENFPCGVQPIPEWDANGSLSWTGTVADALVGEGGREDVVVVFGRATDGHTWVMRVHHNVPTPTGEHAGSTSPKQEELPRHYYGQCLFPIDKQRNTLTSDNCTWALHDQDVQTTNGCAACLFASMWDALSAYVATHTCVNCEETRRMVCRKTAEMAREDAARIKAKRRADAVDNHMRSGGKPRGTCDVMCSWPEPDKV
jgi:hypothetical protein